MAEINPDNLVPSLDEEQVKKIGQQCVDEYDADIESRTDYDERRSGWLKLFAGKREKKSFPWENASNTHIPLLSEACLQFHARAYEALLPPKEVVKGYSTDGMSVDAAERVSVHMNWQVYYQMDEWEEEHDKMLVLLPLMGSAYMKTYYDPYLGRPVTVLLTPDEFVTPYRYKRLADCPRKTHVLTMTLNDIKKRAKDGIFSNVDDKWEGQQISELANMPAYIRTGDELQGQEESTKVSDRRIILEQHRLLDINYDPVTNQIGKSDGIMYPFVVWVDYETGKTLRIVSRLAFDDILQQMETVEYFTEYQFIPNPDSHYAYGFAHFIDHINETADTLLNQLIDAGTLSNVRGGFINQRSGVKKGDLSFHLGEYKAVDIAADDIKKAIYDIDINPPSSVLFTLLQNLQGYVKDLTTTAEWMSGGLPPSDTAATTMLAVIEQGLKVFSAIQRRIHRSLKREFRKIFALNRLYIDDTAYFTVQDSTSDAMKTATVAKDDYANNIDVIPVSDPNITSRAEQLIKSQQVLAEVKMNPLTAENPEALYLATRNYLKVLGVGPELDQIVKKPAPQEPPDLTPQEENAGFLREVGANALPEQDHMAHIFAHETFMQSEWGMRLTPQGKNVLESHVRDHLSMAYMAEEQAKIEAFQRGEYPLPVEMAEVPKNGGAGGAAYPVGNAGMGEESVNEVLLNRISGKAAGGIIGGLQ